MNSMTELGNGLHEARHNEDALPVREAELAMRRRNGDPEENILTVQSNMAITYGEIGQGEKALSMERDVYSGYLKLDGGQHSSTLRAANNYAISLRDLQRLEEAKSLLRKMLPVAHRVLGADNRLTLQMRTNYAMTLYKDEGATLDDLREAVTTLEDAERIARRVFGGAHPVVSNMEASLRKARARLRARETPSGNA